ncbi:hypothetical protein F5Y15DRAFT_93976 [Xylariaceae sp. FL0016]|nr:hypothetical protein F5Y15DRAFT_93976 [Xylariaceae sp. FL0016]
MKQLDLTVASLILLPATFLLFAACRLGWLGKRSRCLHVDDFLVFFGMAFALGLGIMNTYAPVHRLDSPYRNRRSRQARHCHMVSPLVHHQAILHNVYIGHGRHPLLGHHVLLHPHVRVSTHLQSLAGRLTRFLHGLWPDSSSQGRVELDDQHNNNLRACLDLVAPARTEPAKGGRLWCISLESVVSRHRKLLQVKLHLLTYRSTALLVSAVR